MPELNSCRGCGCDIIFGERNFWRDPTLCDRCRENIQREIEKEMKELFPPNVIIIWWDLQGSPFNCEIKILERKTWSKADGEKLIKGNKEDNWLINGFFKNRHFTIEMVKQILPKAKFTLWNEKDNDPRFKILEGWDDIRSQSLPLDAGELQALANFLGVTIWIYGTGGPNDLQAKFWFKCEPH